MFTGFFDLQLRLDKIESNGDPLVALNQLIKWEIFRPDLEPIRDRERKSNAGRKPYDLILMFKILILQSLYNLSDDNTEQQILDRLSFQRFLGLSFSDPVPDAKTIWLFREAFNADDRSRMLFDRFNEYLNTNGYKARKGQIIDAAIVEVPIQRNAKEENERIKQGESEQVKAEWHPAKVKQKDTDARWTKKHGKSYFGYKHHDCVDVKHKLIRSYAVTAANVHDSNVFEELLTPDYSCCFVWASFIFNRKLLVDFSKRGGFFDVNYTTPPYPRSNKTALELIKIKI
jgi:IS5 family transposase